MLTKLFLKKNEIRNLIIFTPQVGLLTPTIVIRSHNPDPGTSS